MGNTKVRRSLWAAGSMVVLLASAVSCSPGETLHTAVSPTAEFTRYRTFSVGAPEAAPAGYDTTARTVEIRRRLKPLVEAALVRRGYTLVPANGDLVITLGAGRHEIVTHEASGVATDWQPDDENSDVLHGAIVVDAVDARSGREVWHGADRVDRDPGVIDEKQLERSVTDLIARFPTAPGGT